MTIRENKPPNPERPQPRFAPGPLGRGVYLSDLVEWLMEKHEVGRVQAITDFLLPVLEGENQPVLYGVKPSGVMTQLGEDEHWIANDMGGESSYGCAEKPSIGRVCIRGHWTYGRR